MRMNNLARLGAFAALIALGLAIRWALRGYATSDAHEYLIPWYHYARDHGSGSLATGFTNYTPLYSYLLLAVTLLDGLAQPLTLVKAISWGVELVNAGLVHGLVLAAGGTRPRARIAFAAAWLAPTVLFNGAAWGQVDALWCGFILAALLLFVRGRDGTPAFAAAFAAKAQGVFLGPFILGQIFGRRIPPWSLLWLPVAYLLFAAPVLIAGRSLREVASVYLGQAQTFHNLSMNAASLWAPLAAFVPYEIGAPLGLALAAVGGLWLAWLIGRSDMREPQALLLAAAASLLLTPFLLPKMHDRYFYAFEMTALVLAAVNPRRLPLALGAQATGLVAYLAFVHIDAAFVRLAAVGNGVMLWALIKALRRYPAERS